MYRNYLTYHLIIHYPNILLEASHFLRHVLLQSHPVRTNIRPESPLEQGKISRYIKIKEFPLINAPTPLTIYDGCLDSVQP